MMANFMVKWTYIHDDPHVYQHDDLYVYQHDNLHAYQHDDLHVYQHDNLHIYQHDDLHEEFGMNFEEHNRRRSRALRHQPFCS